MKKSSILFVVIALFGVLHTEAQDKTGVLKKDHYGAFTFDFYEEILGSDIVPAESRAKFESKANISVDNYRSEMERFVKDVLGEESLKSALANSFVVKGSMITSGTQVYTYGVTDGKIYMVIKPRTIYLTMDESFLYHEPTGIYWLSNACGNPCDFKNLEIPKLATTNTTPAFIPRDGRDGARGERGIQGIQGERGERGDRGENGREIQYQPLVQNLYGFSSQPNESSSGSSEKDLEIAYLKGALDEQAKRSYDDDDEYLSKRDTRNQRRSERDDDDRTFWEKPGGQIVLMTGSTILGNAISGGVNRATYGRGVLGVGAAQYTMNRTPNYNMGGSYAGTPMMNCSSQFNNYDVYNVNNYRRPVIPMMPTMPQYPNNSVTPWSNSGYFPVNNGGNGGGIWGGQNGSWVDQNGNINSGSSGSIVNNGGNGGGIWGGQQQSNGGTWVDQNGNIHAN